MMAQQPESCSVYLDAVTLIDLIDPNEDRHNYAEQLLELFQRHREAGLLRVVTSVWAATEAHGIFYENELYRRNVYIPDSINPRNVLPPHHQSLSTAKQQVTQCLQTLQTTTHDFLLWSQPSSDVTAPLQLAMKIAHEAAIWPADSIHLAIALESNCSILVTDDRDLLDKIHHCQKSLIEPYRKQQFSELSSPPPFQACALQATKSRIPRQNRTYPSALQALNSLGFR